MSYLVLARKFRPQSFSGLVGQEHISRALANAILRQRVPHALLFTGPRGVGKTSSARVFARALNCTGRALPETGSEFDTDAREAVEPCGECTNCIEIAKSTSMAVWEIDGASNNSVDNVRDLIDSLRSVPPPGSDYKIYIIDEVHMLSVAAFNALLKSLEEPPPNTIFIFATTEPHKIPATVISRCQRHDFRRIAEQDIAEQLRSIADAERLVVEDAVFSFLARRAQGGMRDAQSMFDRLISFGDSEISLNAAQRVFGVLDHSFFARLSAEIFGGNVAACFELLNGAFSQSLDIRAFLGDFLEHWRNLLLLSFASKQMQGGGDAASVFDEAVQLTSEERQSLLVQLAERSSFDVQRLFDIAEETVSKAQFSSHPRFLIEAGIAKMVSLPSLRSLPDILSELKQNVAGGAPQIDNAATVTAAVKNVAANNMAVTTAAAEAERPRSLAVEVARQRPSAAVVLQESEIAQPTVPFNPSWQAFVSHVRDRRMPVLEALLKRISPTQFSSGTLLAEASEFDRSTLSDPDTSASLRKCLYSYSGVEQWSLNFVEPASGSGPQQAHLQGSVAADEARRRKQSRLKVEKEARTDPGVKAVLETFAGSRVERVAILNK